MPSALIAGLAVACMVGGALLGFALQRRLPAHHLSKESQDLIKVCAGVIATVTALVLGLLVSSSKASFDKMNSRVVEFGAKVIMVDTMLARLGPEAKPAREELRRSVEHVLHLVWPEEATSGSRLGAVERAGHVGQMDGALRALKPATDDERQLLTKAQRIVEETAEMRWMIVEEGHSKLPITLIIVLVFWLTLTFMSFGLFAPRNPTVVVVLFLSACSMAGAIFLVLEMSQPLDGAIKVSSGPILNALTHLGE